MTRCRGKHTAKIQDRAAATAPPSQPSRLPKQPPILATAKAFSLLELLIVMTLIGLITAVIAPNFGRSLPSLQARSSVNKIAAILRYARSQAVARQQVAQVMFDIPEHRVALLTNPTASKAGNETYLVPKNITMHPSDPGLTAEPNGSFTINFYPGGNSSGGKVTIAGESGRPYQIKVDFITGITEVL